MTDVMELIQAVQAAGATIRADPPDLVISPPGRVPPDLKARLKENKAEILRRLGLEASMRRLEAASVCIAVWDDGSMRILVSESDTLQAIDAGGTIYSPKDMLVYVTLSERERRMLHSFKRKFGPVTRHNAWPSKPGSQESCRLHVSPNVKDYPRLPRLNWPQVE